MSSCDRAPAPIRRIFVSHSVIGTPLEDFLADLRRSAEDAGFSVFVSEHEGHIGAAFRERIFKELHDCSAAILLLSPQALRSGWCHTEISIAMARLHGGGGGFCVLPILLGRASLATLQKSQVGHLGLDGLLMARPPTTTVGDIVAELEARFPMPGPLHHLELAVANELNHVDDGLLGAAAATLGVDLAAWHPTGKRLAVAKAMLAVDQAQFARALRPIRRFLRNHCLVVDLVFPFLWVDQDAVVPLMRAAESVARRGVFSVNARESLTGRWYVRRACTESESWKVVDPAARETENVDAGLVAEIRDLLIDTVKSRDDIDDDGLRSALDRFEGRYGPIFVLLPGSVDSISIEACERHFPTVPFLVIAGHAGASGAATAGVSLLTPLIAPGDEDEAHELYKQLVESTN